MSVIYIGMAYKHPPKKYDSERTVRSPGRMWNIWIFMNKSNFDAMEQILGM